MNKVIAPTLMICSMLIFSSPVRAADACEVVLCLYGKTTDNSGNNECHSAEQSFFNIVKKNRHGFLPDHTADARKSFLLECSSANPAIINQIISKFGRIRGR
ncbi:TrbM/KikA/MpfK family conjugal transfer protein [Yersinia intermedia]|uniref:TrbM/KikA/MpfK family conjugal transfer protein n=1 Tax=Yersinia intermedia TaxID=631 RepID=UPI00119E1FB7|nr:TrbM/KikA/MpfK family conjugal transfer protein [Yersinia intermedia]